MQSAWTGDGTQQGRGQKAGVGPACRPAHSQRPGPPWEQILSVVGGLSQVGKGGMCPPLPSAIPRVINNQSQEREEKSRDDSSERSDRAKGS